jgi:SpoVK/Ycf46/Vps4 family AAA+-type ATPase
MKTPKESPLAVSHFLPEIAFLKREAKIYADESGYLFVQYSGEAKIQERFDSDAFSELLKLIPTFREKPGHLLIVATNYIRALDDAFLRHGRFDYVIPIGLPDAEARNSIWSRYIPQQALENIDVADLVKRTQGFSPADIEYAARKASQRALEQSIYETKVATKANSTTATEHYLWAITNTRRTVSDEVISEFEQDIESIGRL